jgi:uncharacterized Zn finger protein (UPF0148 family)
MDSINCPNCGQKNSEDDRFCSNCGTRLTPVSSPLESQPDVVEESITGAIEESERSETTSVRSTMPPPVTPSFARSTNTNDWESQRVREPVDDDWKMSDLGPPPDRKRRKWWWIVIAILAVLVLLCCGFMFFISATDTGFQWFNDLATQVSEQATEAAR